MTDERQQRFETVLDALMERSESRYGVPVRWPLRLPTPKLMAKLEEYELTAARYGLTLLLKVGAEDLRPWYSDYSACDFRYLKHFYATGEKKPFKGFWQDGQPLLKPLEIPPFEPKRWKMHFDGVVI